MFTYHFTDSERLSIFLEKQHYSKLYKSGIAIFKDYPFFGVGNKNYRVVINKKEYIEVKSTHPHQIYFE